MTDGARQRSSTSGSSKDAAGEKESGGGEVALKKEIGLVSACGIIVGQCPVSFPITCRVVHLSGRLIACRWFVCLRK